MRAVRCEGGAPVVVEVPSVSGDGVRVRVASAGICGSDLHLLPWNLPAVMGHELAGTLADGTSVAVEPIAPCGACAACVAGDVQRCVLGPTMIMGIGRDGGMADECLVPVSALVRLAAGVALRDACLVEPLAVAVHGVRRGHVLGGQRVGVIGGGSIGLATVAAAQAAGASVDIATRHDRQRTGAERLGAGVLQLDRQYDLVIDAAGTSASLAEAIGCCAGGGTVVMVATYWDGDLAVPSTLLSMKEVSLVPASMYGRVGPSRDVDVAAAMLAARPEIADAIITHRFPLDAAADAFAVAQDRSAGAIKVVLEP
ncbi:MAG: Zn-dependent alcohol dehydrogenase [Ilumatobacteraceae bacterium]|nr:Zn-dependent alcohol dehydrogenase [Ilumatobacteraceae bacterium]